MWTEDTVSMWVLVEVIAQDNTLLRVRNKKTGSELEIDLVRRKTETDIERKQYVGGRWKFRVVCIALE